MPELARYIDIQSTARLDQATLIREINKRFRSTYEAMDKLSRYIDMLVYLTTTRSFTLEFAPNADAFVAQAGTDVRIEDISLTAPDAPMTVTPNIDGTPITFDPPSPLSVTAVRQRFTPTANNVMSQGDQLFIHFDTGTNDTRLYAVIHYSIDEFIVPSVSGLDELSGLLLIAMEGT